MSVSRRLVAVVVADVAGYSRLMERDEAGTHERLRALHSELIAPKIAEHGGRTVKTSGDGMLLEFASATSALRCAVEIQREMGVRNLYVAPDERIEFRIGINLGDIIIEGDDIIGDGVNVAARLEALAQPGGICVASAIWEQVHEDLGVEFVDSGEQHVKNISKPIRVFRVALGKESAAVSIASERSLMTLLLSSNTTMPPRATTISSRKNGRDWSAAYARETTRRPLSISSSLPCVMLGSAIPPRPKTAMTARSNGFNCTKARFPSNGRRS